MNAITTRAALALALLAPLAPVGAWAQDEAPAKPAAKASLAVLPFAYNAEVLEKDADGDVVLWIKKFETTAFSSKLITTLVNLRKFEIVEREKIDKLLDEMELGDSGVASSARAVKAGKLVGADYVLTGEISVYNVNLRYVPIADTGRFSRQLMATIIVDMRVVDSRTSRVVAADKCQVQEVNKTIVGQRVPPPFDPTWLDTLQRKLAVKVSQSTVDGVYPIKIASNEDGVILLNRGKNTGLEVGQVLDVYLPGKEVTDPDTGESLGFTEQKIGRVKVTQILAKFSKATALEQGEPLPQGAVCRKVETPTSKPAEGPKRGPRW